MTEPSAEQIEAACAYFYDVWDDDERERMRGVLEAASEVMVKMPFEVICILARVDTAYSHGAHVAENDALYELYRWIEKQYVRN